MKTTNPSRSKLPLAAVITGLVLFATQTHAADNTGTGGTITYTDINGLNPVASPPYTGGYVVHKFTSSDTLNIPVPATAQVLVVAGGGGGGKFGGGGGAGGLIYNTSVSVATGNTTVTVGAGGAGATVAGGTGTKGADSIFGALTATGGGGGGSRSGTSPYPGVNGAAGGSGGGASASDSTTVVTAGGTATALQGNAGGSGRSPAASLNWGSGGGGGASAAGSNATGNNTTSSGGKGGDGLANSITGSSVFYAGGGGGGTYSGAGSGTAGAGGNGGGGAGAKPDATNGTAGTANTGGGGGGGGVNATGGAGGSGIVIVRYPYDSGGPDTTPPTVVTLSPADNATNVTTGTNLVVTFNEAITIGTGNITLKNLSDATDTTIAITSGSPQLSVAGAVLTINPTADLALGKAYAIQIAATAIKDAAGNHFAGIADNTTWNFTASISQVSSSSELAYSADVSNSDLLTGLTATTTGWNPVNGSTTPELNDGIHGRTFADAGNSVEGAFTTVGATAIYNLGISSAGYNLTSIQTIAAWNGAGFGNQAYTVDIKLKGAASYTTLATVNYQPLAAGAIGATKVTLADPSGVLATGVEFIRFTANSVNGGANSGAFVFREIDVFGVATVDVITPTVTALNPADNATAVPTSTNLVATFNENIALGSGNITIKNLDTSALTVIPVGNSQISVSGAVLTINPTVDLAVLKNYAIRIDSGAITDLSANPFAGIADDTSWNFTTASTPLRIMCLGDSITAGYTDNPSWANHPFMFGYRSGLYTRLTSAGYNFKFVGGSGEPWNGAFPGDPTYGGTYTPALDLRTFGQDGHRGYGGASTVAVNGNVAGYIAADTPDVILLLIGINAIGSGSPAALNTLVNTIVTAAPNAHLIVAQITPQASFNQSLYNYNIYIRNTLVPSYVAAGKKVSTVDLYSIFLSDPGSYTTIPSTTSAIAPNVLSNGINHPDNPHYDLMAQRWFTGIEALGLGPNTFSRWIAGFPAVGALTGFNDDPDGDGIDNGLENFFGTSPSVFTAGVTAGVKSGNTFTFTHPQNATPANDLTAAYRWSKDLATFHAAGASDTDGTTVGFVATPNTPTPGITTVTATATVTGTPVARLFVRLDVTQN